MRDEKGEFKEVMKGFIESEKNAEDYLRLLTSYETARNKGIKLSSIVTIIEEETKTSVPD